MLVRVLSLSTVWFACLMVSTAAAPADSPQQRASEIDFFERRIRPLLIEHCYECHSAEAKPLHAGLRLDHPAGIGSGGDSGPVVVPGRPDESLLIHSVRYDDEIQMPPAGKLPDHEIKKLIQWVARGAVVPETENAGSDPSPDSPRGAAIDFEAGREFWSFQPVRKRRLPRVERTDWPKTRVDSFVLAAMERRGLSPAPPADRATLARRLSFDLLGLPPSPELVETFVNDPSPDADVRLVDRLLGSPSYGEKWGRMWLDLARYTDRTASWLYQTNTSHLYRDWVIQAFNDDMPYDDFVRRQLATDLMPQTGPEDLPALGFISLSPTYWKELKLPCEIIKVIVADEWEERVDAVSRTFLGLTVACARCHDHKFDPISSEDYYALAGIFASSRQVERPLIPEDLYAPVRAAKKQVADLEAEIAKLKRKKNTPQETIDELVAKAKSIREQTPHFETPMANALSEESMFVVRAGKTAQEGTKLEYREGPRDLPAFIRGNPNRPGAVVPRRFLTVLARNASPYRQGSGRLELADSIVGDAAPLAARVIVNRIWMGHFGKGLVETPSNFGTQGERPSHPELLDDLAAQFIAEGWSLKQLHRTILLSATWQQSTRSSGPAGSAADLDPSSIDPDNRLLSRMNPRRLTFEEWRDAMLVASGTLDSSIAGPSLALDSDQNHRRTVYATVHRRDMSPTLMVHDFPDPTQHSPKRVATVTALQGLYALNGPLLLDQSKQLAARLQHDFPSAAGEQIRQAYQQLFSRQPNARELRLGLDFLDAAGQEEPTTRLQQYCHVLLASNELVFID